jgi:hypothetical protein
MTHNVSMRLMLLMTVAVTAAFAADISGKWTGQMGGPNGEGMSITFDFKQDGAKLTGTSEGPGGQALQIKDGKVEGDKISFTISFDGGGGDMKILHEGTIKGDEIKLSIKMDGGPGGDGPGVITLKKAK